MHEGQHDVEIVDHQVEHDVYVERSRREHAKTMHFEEHRLRNERESGTHGRIEALQMSNLRHSLVLFRQEKHFVRFGLRGSERLFDEQVDTGLHQLTGNIEMENGRYCHRCCLNFTVGGEHLLDRSEGLAVKLAGDRVGAHGIGIDHSHQPHASGLLQLSIDAGMVTSKGAHAHNCNIDGRFVAQKRLQRFAGGTRYCRSFAGGWESPKTLTRGYRVRVFGLSHPPAKLRQYRVPPAKRWSRF